MLALPRTMKYYIIKEVLSKTKEFVLDILFPKFCLICGREKDYLCQDCFSLIEINERQYCPFCSPPKIVLDGKTCPSCRRTKSLNGLYSATSYDNYIIKKLIYQFKYSHVKELAKPLSSLIINNLINLNKHLGPVEKIGNGEKRRKEKRSSVWEIPLKPASQLFNWKNFSEFILIPIPLYKKKLKERGFNQSEEIAKELSKIFKIPVFNNVLIKTRQTLSQAKLNKEEREKNIKGTFSCQQKEIINGKKILLVDDVFTTGSTMEEGAITLKSAGAKQVWGIVIARG